ncbi:MAG: SIS domain-containing protein, partial [Bacteroidota bacterium]
MSIQQHFIEAREVLDAFISDAKNFEAIDRAGQLLVNSIQSEGKIISCGNGGSLCDAMHFAEELTGRYRNNRPAIGAIAISDPSH